MALHTVGRKVDNVGPPAGNCKLLRHAAVPVTAGLVTLGAIHALAFGTAVVSSPGHS